MEVNLILLTLATIGLVFVLKYAYIFNKPRCLLMKVQFFKELLTCSQCLGFWCGLLAGASYGWYASERMEIFFALVFGFAMSFVCQFADMVMEILDEIIHNERK